MQVVGHHALVSPGPVLYIVPRKIAGKKFLKSAPQVSQSLGFEDIFEATKEYVASMLKHDLYEEL